jgi:CheY-like chemotaxis protein
MAKHRNTAGRLDRYNFQLLSGTLDANSLAPGFVFKFRPLEPITNQGNPGAGSGSSNFENPSCPATKAQLKDTAMTDTAKPRILVVEDDPDLRTIVRLQLSSQGFDIQEATNGAEGFLAIQENIPDCVILDLMMPVMDGFGFLKRVRSVIELQDVPILILTASEDERNRVRGFHYKADAYMSKPYDLQELTDEVQRLCTLERLEY